MKILMVFLNFSKPTGAASPLKGRKFLPRRNQTRVVRYAELQARRRAEARQKKAQKKIWEWVMDLFEETLAKAEKEARLKIQFRPLQLAEGETWASRAAQNCVSIPGLVGPPPPVVRAKKPVVQSRHIITRYEARADYTRAYENVVAQRQEALSIVRAMQRRHEAAHPLVVLRVHYTKERRVQHEVAQRTKAGERVVVKVFGAPARGSRPVNRPLGYYLRKWVPSQFTDIPEGYEMYTPVIECSPRLEREDEKAPRPLSVSLKQRKQRSRAAFGAYDRSNQAAEDHVYPTVSPVGKAYRRALLTQALSKTALGQDLMYGFLRVWVSRMSPRQTLMLDNLVTQANDLQVEPQMMAQDTLSSAAPEQITDKKFNTEITSAQKQETAQAVGIRKGFSALSLSKEPQVYGTMQDRWIPYKTESWSTTQSVNDTVMSFELFHDVIKDNMDSQNVQALLTHRWMRGGAKVKICINALPFQVGCLVVDVAYKNKEDDITLWDNVYTALQRTHAFINAGTSNDVVIDVPYLNPDSLMGYSQKSVYAKISVRVLNPLVVTGKVSTMCSVASFVAFEDMELSGMISRKFGVVEGQMDTIGGLVNGGIDVLNAVNKLMNRDNPPQPLQPVSFVPTGLPSMAYTDHVTDPVNVLRADPRGQTPHASEEYQMDLKHLQTPGFIKTVPWKMNQNQGDLLCMLPVAPVLPVDAYSTKLTVTAADNQSVEGYVVPPLAYLSSFYGKFRGSIIYTGKVVATKFHTGRLIIGSVPLSSDADVDLKDLKYSAYKVIDIGESLDFSFEVPWHWKNSFAPTRKEKLLTVCPARLFLKVLTPLIKVDDVPDMVYVNIFCHAGPDYELALLRPTLFDPILEKPLLPPSTQYLKPYNFENYWYTTYQRNITTSSGYATTIYFQSISDGWVGYLNPVLGAVYKLRDTTTKGRKFRCFYPTKDKDGNIFQIQIVYGVADPDLTTSNAKGLLIFGDEKNAIAFAAGLIKGTSRRTLRSLYAVPYVQDGEWSEVLDGANWVTAADSNDPPLWQFHKQATDLEAHEFEIVSPQGLEQETSSTRGGLSIFGEMTPDLKSLCRRYNHLSSISADPCIKGKPRDCPYVARIRVNPFRLIDPDTSASYDNRHRHGVISTVAAMFRGWRGSIRYRFAVVGTPPEGTLIYAMHRYDDFMPGSDIMIEKGPSAVRTRDDLMNTQYATFSQALTVNTTFSIEVPYYQEKEFSSLFLTSDPEDRDNGSLYLWVHAKTQSQIHLEVFYSLGDDFQFSGFMGIPVCQDVSNLAPEPQMDTGDSEPLKEVIAATQLTPVASSSFRACIDRMSELKMKPKTAPICPTEPNGLIDIKMPDTFSSSVETLSADMSKTAQAVTKVAESTNKLLEGLLPAQELTEDSLKKAPGGPWGLLQKIFSAQKSNIFNIVTHLVYVALSPTLATLAWAIINLYHGIFGFEIISFPNILGCITSLWESLIGPSKQPQEVKVEPQSGDPSIGSLAGLIFTGITTMCQLKMKIPRDLNSLTDGLFKFSTATRHSMFVSKFFEDNIELAKRVIRKIRSYFVSDSPNIALIAGCEDERLATWFTEAAIITSPANHQRVMSEPDWATKTFELAVIGRALQVVVMQDKLYNSRLATLVTSHLEKLKKLEKDLVEAKTLSGIRYEPFCLWISGAAGTGKTRYLEGLADEFAAQMKMNIANTYHTITAGQKYMDGFNGHPTIIIDDFLSVGYSADPESFARYLQMKSSINFNPPFSAVEDKNKLINFYNLFISSNFSTMDGLPGLHDSTAYNRRRNSVIHFSFKDKGLTAKEVFQKYSQEERENLEHLNIYEFEDADKPEKTLVARVAGETYRDTLTKLLFKEMRAYHNQEMERYRKRSVLKMQNLAKVTEGISSFDEQVKAFQLELQTVINKDPSQNIFNRWLTDMKQAATFEPQPQMDNEDFYPISSLDGWAIYIGKKVECCHTALISQPWYPVGNKTAIVAPTYEPLSDMETNFAPLDFCDAVITKVSGANPVTPCRMIDVDLRREFALKFLETIDDDAYLASVRDGTRERGMKHPDLTYGKTMYAWCVEAWTYRNRWHETSLDPNLANEIRAIQMKLRSRLVEYENGLYGIRWNSEPLIGKVLFVLKNLLQIFAIIFGTYVLIKGMRSVFSLPSRGDRVESQITTSGDYKNMRSAQTMRHKAMSLISAQGPEIPAIAMLTQQHNQAGAMNKIRKNTVFLVNDQEPKVAVRCLGLYEKTFLVIKHYIDHYLAIGTDTIHVVYEGAKAMHTLRLSEIKFFWTEQGYGIGTLPASAPRQFANIVKLMPSDAFDGNYPTDALVMELGLHTSTDWSVSISQLQKPLTVPGNLTQSSWVINQGIKYDWGGKGRCGSIVVCPSMATPLIAVHTAGQGEKVGFAELLFRETFLTPEKSVIEFQEPQMANQAPKFFLDGLYSEEGGLDADMIPSMSLNTRIEPSEIQGVFPVSTEPAPLHPLDERLSEPANILAIGVSKRCKPTYEFPEEDIQLAHEDMEARILAIPPCRAKVGKLTMAEAVEGFEIKYYDALDLSTSEGFPWSKLRPDTASGKRWMFELDEDAPRLKVKTMFAPLVRIMLEKAEMRRQGIVPTTYFTACLKDARIPKEKISTPGKTRVFEMSPVELTIAQRQLFLDFTVAYRQARFEHTIGINPDGPEWTTLARDLTEFSSFILTADYSGYGPSVNHTILHKTFDLSRAWFRKYQTYGNIHADDAERATMAWEVAQGLHVVKDLVFRPSSGLPSGNCETVDRNSLVNSYYIRIAYLGLAREHAPTLASMRDFHRYVLMRHNGDDLIIAVKEDIISWFNNLTLIEYFARFKIKMTDALKSGVAQPYCSIYEASYLKRTFIPHPYREGEWLGALDVRSVQDTANWVWRSLNRRQASLVNSDAACRLAYTNGPEVYERVVKQLKAEWKRRGVIYDAPLWVAIDASVWECGPSANFQYLEDFVDM